MAYNFGPKIVSDGLVMYYDSDNLLSLSSEAFPTTWRDISTSKNSIPTTNPTLTTSFGNPADPFRYFSFSSAPQPYLITPTTTSNLNVGSAGAVTIEITMLYPSTTAGLQNIFSYGGSYGIGIIGNQLAVSTGTGGTSMGFNVQTGIWHHIVLTYNPGGGSVYIDGVFQGFHDNFTTTNTHSGHAIATGTSNGSTTSNSYFYTGNLSMIRVYNRELSINEVKNNQKIISKLYSAEGFPN